MKRPDWPNSYMVAAFAMAVTGLLLCAISLFLAPISFLAGWFTTVLFVLGLPLGAMTILMVHGLTGGRWGDALQPPLRAMVATLPLTLLLLLPVLVRLDVVFPWAEADTSKLSEAVQQKLAYLNAPFFIIRFIVCATLWLVLGWLTLGWTAPERDKAKRRTGRGYAIGLVAQGFAVSVFAIDWMLSIEPNFYSTIYAMLEAAGEVVGAGALALMVLAASRAIETMPGGEEDVALSEDVANMLFGFMLLLAYLAFMQWLIAWAGDLPDEIHWYLIRGESGWQYLLWLLIALEFVAPFVGFLNRSLKRSHDGLMWLGALVLAGHLADVVWRVRPPLPSVGPFLSWPDLAALAGAGGLWCAGFLYAFARLDRIALWRGSLAHG